MQPPLPSTAICRLRSRFRRSNDSFSDTGSQRGGGSRLSKEDHPHKDGQGHMASHQGKAELHLIGEISGASGFDEEALYCKWQLIYEPSKTWQVLRGLEKVRRLQEYKGVRVQDAGGNGLCGKREEGKRNTMVVRKDKMADVGGRLRSQEAPSRVQ